jgi:P pilus assembly chaperone PapD
MKNKSWIILLIITITTFAPALLFSAGVSVTVSPIRVEHLVNQGEEGTDTITVTNDGTTSTRMQVSIEDWSLTTDGTPIFIKQGNNPYSCAGWIQVNPTDFKVEPGQTTEVRYTITVPEGIKDGGYHAALIFETVPDVTVGEKTKGVSLRGRIATILYEKVGNPDLKCYANSLKTIIKKDGADFILALQNTGKAHVRTKGSITVKDSNGGDSFKVDVPDVPVLPESERNITISYDKAIPKGKYTATAVVDIGKKELIGAETTFEVE